MPSLEENFPHVHLNHTLFEFIDNDSLWDASDFLDAINKHRVNILGPDPFGRNKRSAADRYVAG